MSSPASGRAAVVGGKAAGLLELRRAGFPVPPFLCSPADLAGAVHALGLPLAVRSSAAVEDGPAASFAGQFRSFLNLGSLAEVEDAVHQVVESGETPSVRAYCRRHGLDPSSLRMGYVVQCMVRAELAGAAFTVNPATGAEEVVIEACEGTAEALLEGQRAPLPADHPLLQQHRPAIERLARRIHRHFGAPQDVEFAIEGGVLYVVQARPITRIGFASDPGEWTTADFRDGGVSSTVCTPLMGSLYELVWDDALKGCLRELRLLREDFPASRLCFGRPYWNLGAVKRCLERLPGYVEREFDADLGVEAPDAAAGVTTPYSLGAVLGALPTVLAVRRFLRRQAAEAAALLEGGYDRVERAYAAVPAEPERRFQALIERAYLPVERTYFRTIFATSLAKLALKTSFPDVDPAPLLAGLPALRHLEPLAELRRMAARGETDVTPLLRRFRHHSRRELDLRAPRWDEDAEFVRGLLAATDPRAQPPAEGRFEAALAEALRRAPFGRRGQLRRQVERLRRFVWLREELRDVSGRMYYLIRRWTLALARRRGLGDDVFFMTFRELVADDRSQVERAREVYESYRNFSAPPEIGARFVYAPAATPGGALTGLAASPGLARGPARLARTLEEAMTTEPGAILVCPFTTPAWVPVLDRVRGVVTETGGLLSHAAVICRECGVPAVLGVRRATERIPPGRTISVDGSRGRVSVDP
jgi:pyruvate,water dikinase